MNRDSAVRAYMKLLATDPASLPADPLERLMLRAHIERGFVEHAAAWAHDHGVTGDAFAAEGVPDEILRRAGLGMDALPLDDQIQRSIRSAMPECQPFSEDGLVTRTGATRRDVRSVIAADLGSGRINEHAVSKIEGRADKKLYRRAS